MKLATLNPTGSSPIPNARPAPARPWLRTARAAFGLAAPLALATALAPTAGQAEQVISAAPYVTIPVNGMLAADHDVVVDNQLGVVLRENLGPRPTASDVIALGAETDGDRLIAFDTPIALPGGPVAADEDFVRFDGASFSLEADMTGVSSSWGPADMDAVLVPEPGFGGALVMGAGLIVHGSMRRRRRARAADRLSPVSVALGLVAMAFAAAGGASASDGVLEINQTCALQTGCFPGDTPGFPVTINLSRSFRLTSSLTTPNEDVTAIAVNVKHVSLDLGGFGLFRTECAVPSACLPTAGSGYGIRGFVRGLHVRNGSIVGMGADGVAVGDDAIVEDLILRRNGRSGINADSNSIVRNCVVVNNLEDGIRTFRASVVADNVATENQRYGLFVDAGSRVSGNTSDNNTLDGIRATASVVVDNAVTQSDRHGIHAINGSSVARNMVRENTGYGLVLTGGSAYRENVISGNPTGPVFSGVNLGSNSCDGTVFCP